MKELTLRETQLAELEILKAFDKFCKDNELIYTLVGGTLLGAIRHKGFIPWDDDIDVGMPRPDYEKFFEAVRADGGIKTDSGKTLELIPDRGDNAKLPFLKLVDTDYVIESAGGEETEHIWIDIFPVDGYPADDEKAAKLCKKMLHYRRVAFYNLNNGKGKRGVKKAAAKLYSIYARMYGTQKALRKISETVKKYPYEKSDFIGILTWGLYGAGERINKHSFDNIVELSFEDGKFSAISNWDEYLKGIYGDYMTLPPENKRGTHGFKVYLKEK